MSKPRLSVLLPALTAMAAAAAFVLVPGGVANFLAPFAGMAWLFLRVFVLSIDQSVYWILVICAAVFVLAARLSRLKPAEEEAEGEAPRPGPEPRRLEEWRGLLAGMASSEMDLRLARKALVDLLVQAYAFRERVPANYLVADAFKRREIPLSEELHAFLFGEAGRGGAERRPRLERNAKARYRRAVELCLDYVQSYHSGETR